MGIALIVAGIGIMNIMTVSLIERTREIGILKALGEDNTSILSIFIIEAVLMGVIGSVIGIFAGYLIAWIYGASGGGTSIFGRGGAGGFYGFGARSTSVSSFVITPSLTPEIVLLGLVFGILISVVFGILPALKASRLKPVDALRNE